MGSLLKVRQYGDPCLRQKSVLVEEIGVPERMLIQAMVQTMHEDKGIGLAAPQVGINKRIFVIDIGDGPMVFINPKIINAEGASVLEEGCLSIPEALVKVERPEKIRVQYRDEDNKLFERDFDELQARVIQHENDHLDGKMIVDYATEEELAKWKKKLEEIEKEKK